MDTETNARRGGNPGGAIAHADWNGAHDSAVAHDRQGSRVAVYAGKNLVGRVIGTASKHLAFRVDPSGLIQIGAIFADRAAAIRAITGAL